MMTVMVEMVAIGPPVLRGSRNIARQVHNHIGEALEKHRDEGLSRVLWGMEEEVTNCAWRNMKQGFGESTTLENSRIRMSFPAGWMIGRSFTD